MQLFLQMVMGGLTVGAVYALLGMGYSLIYRASGLLTFAQGEYFMLGAFVGLTFFVNMGLPFPLVLILTTAVMVAIGFLSEKVIITPLISRGSKPIHIVLATIGLAIFLQNLAMLVWGSRAFTMPTIFDDMPVFIGSVFIIPQNIAIVIAMLVLMGGLHLFMNKSRAGLMLRAAAQDRMAASIVGINVPLAIGLTWGISVGLAGLAGLLIAPVHGVHAHMGLLVGLKGFAAAVIGGYGSIYGAVIGGILVGLVETFTSGYISSNFKDVVVFAFLLLVLFLKPEGLIRSEQIDK
ncbi:MAG TPA: branched-chain amino acid ABC transporter permease [Devosia sp.]|nr:branched-chain amino acid ABC transporter permease [Devosia sp.]